MESLNGLGRRTPSENAKAASNWVMTDVLRALGERKETAAAFPVAPARLGALIGMVQDGTLSGTAARQLFEIMLTSPDDPHALVQRLGLAQVSDQEKIAQTVEEVLSANLGQVQKYLGGSEKIFGFFVGETMRRMAGKGNPKMINDVLKQKLKQRRA